jgi:hypothetical protein
MELLGKWLIKGETLVTLTGAGGSGKTRLAIETLRRLLDEWQGRIYFVPLASLWDAALFFSAIRDALGIVASPDVPPLEQIASALRDQKCVVLLDNLEQLSQSGAAHLQELRERLPQATFMVTSRALLHLPGEREFSVMPLPTPLESAGRRRTGDYPVRPFLRPRRPQPHTGQQRRHRRAVPSPGRHSARAGTGCGARTSTLSGANRGALAATLRLSAGT